MKVTRNQLRKLVLKEFKNTSLSNGNMGISDIIGGFPPPPDDHDQGEPSGRGCPPEKFDRLYNEVADVFESYMSIRFDDDILSYFEYIDNLVGSRVQRSFDIISDELFVNITDSLCRGKLKSIFGAFDNPQHFL
jgi:hypothetical protein